MKKIFSLMLGFLLMLTLTSCGKKEEIECEPQVVEKEVIVDKIVEKEVIKEVPVEIEVPGEFEYVRMYKPGTYFKSITDYESGVTTFAIVVVDKYGEISGIHIDNTNTNHEYKYDEETKELFVRVEGVEDTIPNTYRLVTLGKELPKIEDAIKSYDLVEGYPAHDSRIDNLADYQSNETQAIMDELSDKDNTWSDQMKKVVDKIIKDQSTYGINLYNAGNELKTNSIKDVDVSVDLEIKLVQDILDNDAKLDDETILSSKPTNKKGIYNPGSYFGVTTPVLGENGLIYTTAFIVVDKYGEITGTLLDETTTVDGKASTKQMSDDAWKADANNVSNAIVKNQGTNVFKYKELGSSKDAKYSDIKENSVYKTPVEIDNIESSILANGIIEASNKALDSQAKLALEAGAYYVTDGKNIMTLVIGANDESKMVIKSLSLDTLETRDQAYIDVEGEEYPLYSFEKGSLDLSLEEQKKLTYIYKDKDNYYYAENQGIDKGYELGDKVNFDYAGYDEEATIKVVKANTTKHSLKDRYGMASEENLEWYKQVNLYTKEFIGKDSAYILNMIDETHQDTISGVTIAVKEYNDLLVKALLLATDSSNASEAIVTSGAGLEALNAALEGTDKNYKLGDGSYYAVSSLPNEKGEYYYLTVTVSDGVVNSLILDEITEIDSKLVSKVSLGESYKVEQDKVNGLFKTSTDKDAKSYSDLISSVLTANFNVAKATGKDNSLLDVLEGYDYELDTMLEEDFDVVENEVDLYKWNDAFEKILLEGLQSRVSNKMNDIVKELKENLKDKFIVASDGTVDIRTLEGTYDSKQVASGYLNTKISDSITLIDGQKIEVEIEALDKSCDVDTIVASGKNYYILTADAKDVETSFDAEFLYTLQFDDYEVLSGTIKVPVKSNLDYKDIILNPEKKEDDTFLQDNLGLKYNSIVEGVDIKLLDVDSSKLGNAEANSNLYYQFKDFDNVEAYVKYIDYTSSQNEGSFYGVETIYNSATKALNLSKVYYNGFPFPGFDFAINGAYNNDGTTIPEIITFQDAKLVITNNGERNMLIPAANFATVDITKEEAWTGLDVDTITMTLEGKDVSKGERAKVIANLFKVDKNDVFHPSKDLNFLKKGTSIITVVQDASYKDAKGSLTVKAFYDAYDVKDGKGTYQKGEAYRDETITVYTEESAIRYAKEKTHVGAVMNSVTSAETIDLTDSKEIKIDGLDIYWTVELNGKSTGMIPTTTVDVVLEEGKDPIKLDVIYLKLLTSDYKFVNLIVGIHNDEVVILDKNLNIVDINSLTGAVNFIYSAYYTPEFEKLYLENYDNAIIVPESDQLKLDTIKEIMSVFKNYLESKYVDVLWGGMNSEAILTYVDDLAIVISEKQIIKVDSDYLSKSVKLNGVNNLSLSELKLAYDSAIEEKGLIEGFEMNSTIKKNFVNDTEFNLAIKNDTTNKVTLTANYVRNLGTGLVDSNILGDAENNPKEIEFIVKKAQPTSIEKQVIDAVKELGSTLGAFVDDSATNVSDVDLPTNIDSIIAGVTETEVKWFNEKGKEVKEKSFKDLVQEIEVSEGEIVPATFKAEVKYTFEEVEKEVVVEFKTNIYKN